MVFSTLQTTTEIPPSVALDAPATPLVDLSWNSDYVNVHVDAVERHLKARSPEKFTDVCHEKVTDEDGFLSSSTMIPHEGTYLDQSRGQRVCVSAFHPDTDSALHDERVIAVREELNLHLSLHLDVTDGMRPPLNLLLTGSDADCLDASFFLLTCCPYLASYTVSFTICLKKTTRADLQSADGHTLVSKTSEVQWPRSGLDHLGARHESVLRGAQCDM